MKAPIACFIFFICSMSSAESQRESIWFVGTESRPPNQTAALAKVAGEVAKAGYNPEEFRARIICDKAICTIDVFPKELETKEYRDSIGCPLKLCATMVYSKESQTIVEKRPWR